MPKIIVGKGSSHQNFGEGEKNIGHKICWNQKIRGWKFSPKFLFSIRSSSSSSSWSRSLTRE